MFRYCYKDEFRKNCGKLSEHDIYKALAAYFYQCLVSTKPFALASCEYETGNVVGI